MVTSTQDWLDAQIGVLGSVLVQPDLAAKVLAETCEEDFSGHCLTVYRAIRSLFQQGKPTDPIMVSNALGGTYADFLMQVMEITPTSGHLDYYISACRSRSQLLQLRNLGQALQDAETLEDAQALLEKANRSMVSRTGVEIVTMEDAMNSFFERHEGEKEYLSWPIDGLNEKLYAEPGDFIVLGGYPSDGKSALAIQMAFHMADTKRVGFFSLETNPNKLHDRLMAHAVRIPMNAIKTNSLTDANWTVAGQAASRIIAKNLEYIPAAGKSVTEIQAISQARRYEVIFVDYLQLVSGRGKDRFSVVTDVSIGLHTMAQSTGITVVALAQLRRAETGKDKRTPPPELSSLRESGQIEQDADIVFMVYRPDFNRSDRMLLIRKNKEGELGSIELDFDGRYQTFTRSRVDKYKSTQKAIRQAGRQEYERLPDDTPVPFEPEQTQMKF